MPRVIHFEVTCENPERAAAFYSNVFGWQVNKWGGPVDYWLAQTGQADAPGINGALMKAEGGYKGTINTLDVEDVERYCQMVTENGGKVVAPKMPVPGVGWFAYCQDTEGNLFGMMQLDSNAK